ncbi:MAG: divergent polysaccharide deacetylase family protein [Octadecabacter sp.]
MRGLIGGILTGGLVSAVGLGAASVMTELPAGVTPPAAPLVDAPMVDSVDDPAEASIETASVNSPVGSVSIDEPQAPALPAGEAGIGEPDAPQAVSPETNAPRADTDPLDEPDVVSIEGALEAPDTGDIDIALAEPVDPVLPNPQAIAPATPDVEADLTVSTTPAQPVVVVEPDTAPEIDRAAEDGPAAPQADETDDTFVVDLGAAAPDGAVENAPTDLPADNILAAGETQDTPRFQLQGGENTLLGDRETGVTVRRPTDAAAATAPDSPDVAADVTGLNALKQYAADAGDVAGKPLLSIVLIDDGSMSAAAAALAGLPFTVTIALDPSTPDVGDLMERYRNDGFEVAVMAKLPEGALPSDVEVNFQSVFATMPESIALLDIGSGGLQEDRAVTEQAMDILAEQGRGFVTASEGLNMASRAAEAAGVPAAVVYRDIDDDDQDARIVRRFLDQAAFRARQDSGVVLVGRVRPDTISALILWGTANSDDQVAIVPLSAVLLEE